MRNKNLINRGNNITQGWQLSSTIFNIALKKEGGNSKLYYNTGYLYLVTHPSTNSNPAQQGLTLLSAQNMLLSLWYGDSTLNAFL